ncbi:MAG: hypothetical protein R3242_11475 [Akkermansiaceae bacterium]|nr:hypothetical protein [Akkermansiaceae bacterium]
MVALFALAAIAKLGAQPVDKVEIQFVSFPAIADPSSVELRIGPEEAIEVELPTRSLSEVYRVNRMSHWLLGRSGVDEEGNFAFTTYGKTKVGNGSKQIILVMPKGKNYSDGLEMIALNGSQEGLGLGKYLVYNASRTDIAGKIGDKGFNLKQGGYTILDPEPNEVVNNSKYLFVHLFYRKGDEPKPFKDTKWRHTENAKFFVFFHHNPGTPQIQVHYIRYYP